MQKNESKSGDEKVLKFAEQGIMVTTEERRYLSPAMSIVKIIRRFIPNYRPLKPNASGDRTQEDVCVFELPSTSDKSKEP